jgi:hypothetical protein
MLPLLLHSISLSQVANIPFSTLFSGVFNLCSFLQSTDQGTCITTSGKIVVIWSTNFRPATSVVVTAIWSTIRVFWDDAASVCRWFLEFPKKVSSSPSRAQTFIKSEILQGVLCEVKKKRSYARTKTDCSCVRSFVRLSAFHLISATKLVGVFSFIRCTSSLRNIFRHLRANWPVTDIHTLKT